MTNIPPPSVGCNAAYVASMAVQAQDNGYEPALDENSGYFLINGNLVPESFVTRVADQLGDSTFDYGGVLSEADLFGDDFLAHLDATERATLMPVVMHLIARGDFPFNVFGTELRAA